MESHVPELNMPAVSSLIPHTGPSVLLDELLLAEEDHVRCRTVIRRDMWFVRDGAASSTVCIEMMAQAIAAWAGYHQALAGESVTNAFLLSCRELVLSAPTIAVADVLDVEARIVWNGGSSLGSFACTVLREDVKIAEGTLNVYRGELPNLEAS